jgi:hypothetical protein
MAYWFASIPHFAPHFAAEKACAGPLREALAKQGQRFGGGRLADESTCNRGLDHHNASIDRVCFM